jgi:hypothetical protein
VQGLPDEQVQAGVAWLAEVAAKAIGTDA